MEDYGIIHMELGRTIMSMEIFFPLSSLSFVTNYIFLFYHAALREVGLLLLIHYD